jgi:hypothetical protein
MSAELAHPETPIDRIKPLERAYLSDDEKRCGTVDLVSLHQRIATDQAAALQTRSGQPLPIRHRLSDGTSTTTVEGE